MTYRSMEKKVLFNFQNAVSSLHTVFVLRNAILKKKRQVTAQPKTEVSLNGETRSLLLFYHIKYITSLI